MKKSKIIACLFLSAFLLSGCGENTESQQNAGENGGNISVNETEESNDISSVDEVQMEMSEQEIEETENDSRILIAYFTRLENTDADLDAIVQGGGPYGEIGNSYAEADMDAISSASITVRDNEAEGNTQVVAEMIRDFTGGELFSIRTEENYPVDYDELIDAGEEERNAGARPELTDHVENMENYDVIFLGFPNWWMDMPMAMYSFLESYDLSGKTIIPFATSAGSGLSDAIESIREVQPEAKVEENGLHIPMREVAGAENRIDEWLLELGESASVE